MRMGKSSEISSIELDNYLQEKGIRINGICECCGKNDWVLLTNFASLILQDSETSGLASYPVVALECTNCGNLRLFGRKRIAIKETR